MEKKELKKLFPHLVDEIETGASKIDLNRVNEPAPSTEPGYKEDRKYTGFQPGPVDFIRRCRTPKQAEEIITYLEKKGDINKNEAETLRGQLKGEGLRSFGPHKGPGFYEK